ncbi:MAG: 3-oxoacyl-[acyl-carrier-protein] synthase 2 [Chroococcidiopsis sp. SAG 2025]|uniref:beta-ketoacyl-ACP synthase n=1 Tax=Chroococcidiopsis sp. SAG 2025 TaxID=171389 RepID=UPI0029370EF4|nr:beta-ketoacyl-ACP synthase [Chroococcidiopsis sp. SAG 2025]MDV2991093.1 3-oxoacyl-[acyl-carrier-protein] synthase 2 [Chroococcidiopsis sp. SAG 2025]
MEVVVTGIGLISSLGKNLETSWENLILDRIGISLQQPFSELATRPLALIDEQPTNAIELTQLAVAAALKDSGLESPLPDCGVVIGSSRSQQAVWEELIKSKVESQKSKVASTPDSRTGGFRNPSLPTPEFSETLPNAIATVAARQIGATGIVSSPMAACATGIWAIAQGSLLIKTGQCPRAIVGAVEAPITPLTLAGFGQMGALATTGAYPFDRHREGLVLGEGASVLVLESARAAQQRSAKIYGRVLGFGLTNDAFHAAQPEPTGKSAIAAIKQCLDRSNLTPKDIGYIHAHGTATQLNDKREAQIIQYLFPHGVPVSSTKGATGHTLGASGAIGAAFCLMALRHQILPPCTGLRSPQFDLDLMVTSRKAAVRHSLCLSFGFGGQNAVLALGK